MLAKKNLEAAQSEGYFNSIALGATYWGSGNTDRMNELLQGCPTRFRHWEWGRLKYLTQGELLTFKGHGDAVSSVAFSPDGLSLAAGCGDGVIRIYQADPWWFPGEPPPWKREAKKRAPEPPKLAAPAEKPKAEEQF